MIVLSWKISVQRHTRKNLLFFRLAWLSFLITNWSAWWLLGVRAIFFELDLAMGVSPYQLLCLIVFSLSSSEKRRGAWQPCCWNDTLTTPRWNISCWPFMHLLAYPFVIYIPAAIGARSGIDGSTKTTLHVLSKTTEQRWNGSGILRRAFCRHDWTANGSRETGFSRTTRRLSYFHKTTTRDEKPLKMGSWWRRNISPKIRSGRIARTVKGMNLFQMTMSSLFAREHAYFWQPTSLCPTLRFACPWQEL